MRIVNDVVLHVQRGLYQMNRARSKHDHARAAGFWRLDRRWRNVVPHGRPVWLPWMRQQKEPRVNAS